MTVRQIVLPSDGPTGRRFVALDQLRGFVVVLVVLHHAVLAYCTFGHIDHIRYVLSTAPVVDAQRWVGFDLVVLLNDGFFMPLLFLLSGLFVWDGLVRKRFWRFLRGRLLRLALPFAVAELTVTPLAYYPSFLQAGGAHGFLVFWMRTVTMGPWPSGPAWFIAILFLFDAAAALVFTLSHGALPTVVLRKTPKPIRCYAMLLVSSILVYLPLLIAFGPARWISFGPAAVQVSRILLYAAYFTGGVVLGAGGMASVIRCGQVLASRWVAWAAFALLVSVVFVAIRPLLAVISGEVPRWANLGLAGVALATYCTAVCFALMAVFLRFGGHSGPFWSSLTGNGFAIYLLHYPAVTWVQYALLQLSASAVVKGMTTFAVALAVSWLGAVLLRRLPLIAGAI